MEDIAWLINQALVIELMMLIINTKVNVNVGSIRNPQRWTGIFSCLGQIIIDIICLQERRTPGCREYTIIRGSGGVAGPSVMSRSNCKHSHFGSKKQKNKKPREHPYR